MVTVAMSNINTRVAVATIATDSGTWGNDGGGGAVVDEADNVYEGASSGTAQSRKVGTTLSGRNYTHGSGTDMDGTPMSTAHWMCKTIITNFRGLVVRTGPAHHVKMGSSASDYHEYWLYGGVDYPPRGGWQIVPIAPSVSGYAAEATDTGSPNDSSILYWSVLGDFSATSKAENVIIDAIDCGLGLNLVSGDGASADGTWQDFVDYDEGTNTNRWGYVFTEGGKINLFGQMAIGQTSAGTSTVTEFTDVGKVVTWRNSLCMTGFNRLLIDLATSGTAVSMTDCVLDSLGQEDNDGDRGYTTTEDSRPIFEVTGAHASANLTMTGCFLINWASFVLNLQCAFDNCVFLDAGQIDCGTGATLNGCKVTGFPDDGSVTDTSNILWNVNLDPNGDLDDITIAKGPNAHHAIEFGTSCPLTMNLTGLNTSGFHASDGNFDSTFYFADRGTDVTWNVNISGGTGNFSYKKARAGDTVNITSDVTVTFDGMKDNTEVRIFKTSDDSVIAGIENATTGTPDNRSFAWTSAAATGYYYRLINNSGYVNIEVQGQSVPTNDTTIQIQQRVDRNQQ